MTPPASLIEQAVAKTMNNGNISQPMQWATASKKTPKGTIQLQWALPQAPSGTGGTSLSCFADVSIYSLGA
jgi:hypothetical protein